MVAAAGSSSDFVSVLVAFIAVGGSLGGIWLNRKVGQVHTLVNSQMSDALKRIAQLEQKLGLAPGEVIPTAPIVTASTHGGIPKETP